MSASEQIDFGTVVGNVRPVAFDATLYSPISPAAASDPLVTPLRGASTYCFVAASSGCAGLPARTSGPVIVPPKAFNFRLST